MNQNCKIAKTTLIAGDIDTNVNHNQPNVNLSDTNVNLDKTKLNVDQPSAQFKCQKCYKYFASQSNLKKHNDKGRCKSIKHPLECYKCHEVFSCLPAKSRHQKICKGLIINTLSVPAPPCQQILTQNNNTNCNNNNTTTTYNQQNVYINNFGSENMSHISHKFLDDCLLNFKRGVCNYIEKVNFNPDVPENHNIRFQDVQNVRVKESDNTWRLRRLEHTVDNLIHERCRELQTHYDSNDYIGMVDANLHFNVIRDHLHYLKVGVKKEIKPIYDNVVSLLRELEQMYRS